MAAFEMIWVVGTSVGGFGLDIDIVDDDDEDDEEDMDGGDQQGWVHRQSSSAMNRKEVFALLH